MFAVKSEYFLQPSRDITISFYVADETLFFKVMDIAEEIYGSIFGYLERYSFDNYQGYFVKQVGFFNLFWQNPEIFARREFWQSIVKQNYSKVVTEVRDAQHFVKEHFCLDLPQDWKSLNVDAIIANLPVKAIAWIEKCHNSLRILATNNGQKQIAREVFDEAWKILQDRKKDEKNRLTLREVLDKTGLPVDAFIQGMLNVHKANFDNEQARRQSEFDKRHEQFKADLYQLVNNSRVH